MNERAEVGPIRQHAFVLLKNGLSYARSLVFTNPLIYLYTGVMGTLSLIGSIVDSGGRWQHGCARVWSWLILKTGRIAVRGISGVSQSTDDLRARGILLDGDKDGYLLQAFCKDRSDRFVRSDAGPICLELIQRCGATGFGEGNFRALFEAMSREQE